MIPTNIEQAVLSLVGDYSAWTFSAWMFGSLGVGLTLRLKWWQTFPIALFGIFLGFLSIEHQYTITATVVTDSFVSGVASTFSTLFLAICLLVLYDPSVVMRIFGSNPKQ